MDRDPDRRENAVPGLPTLARERTDDPGVLPSERVGNSRPGGLDPITRDNTPGLSARQRMVLTHLVASGGERTTVRLARDVIRHRDSGTTDPAALQRAYLAVSAEIEELARDGVVTYSADTGRVSLS